MWKLDRLDYIEIKDFYWIKNTMNKQKSQMAGL